VKGIIVAGLADLKTELAADKMMDPRIKVKILRTVDISYGMERGLQEAIGLSEDILADATLTKERKLLQSFFDEVAKPEGNYATGTREVLLTLEQSAVDLLLCWEELPILRCALHHAKEESIVAYFTPSPKKRQPSITDLLACKGIEDPTGYEMVECVPLVEWLCDNYDNFGARLEFVSSNSDQGAQFASGFGGLGAVLRYRFDTSAYDDDGAVIEVADESDEEAGFFMDDDGGEDESSESDKDDSSDWDSFNAEGAKESTEKEAESPRRAEKKKPDPTEEQKEVPKTVPVPKKTFNVDAPVLMPKKAAPVSCAVAPESSPATDASALLAN